VNTEREYYENDEFWNESAVRDSDRERVAVLARAMPEDVDSVLDAGCGNGIFMDALRGGQRSYSRIVGLDRSIAALSYAGSMRICGSIDDLPVGRESFDMVAALEVIEHLPVPVYRRALAEVCRVARRYVLVSVPYRQDLEASLISCPACRSRFNPDYHVRSFDESTLDGLLSSSGFDCVRLTRLGTYWRYRGVDALRSLGRRNASAGNPFTTEIPCPMCGFRLAGSPVPPAGAAIRSAGPPGLARRLVKSVWPKTEGHTWIAALYVRKRAA
jgi:SAM-dependent methyltransferase